MSYWDNSHWADYSANILNVFAGGGAAWLDFRYTIGHVGWRQVVGDSPNDISQVLTVALYAKETGANVSVRVTNAGEITAIQTEGEQGRKLDQNALNRLLGAESKHIQKGLAVEPLGHAISQQHVISQHHVVPEGE